MTTGWRLQADERVSLLCRFPPCYARTVADHVTLVPPSGGGAAAALPAATTGRIVGRADDGVGVEALVVEIDGATDREGGGTFHITWSLAEGRAAKESNAVITALGFEPVDGPAVTLIPARW